MSQKEELLEFEERKKYKIKKTKKIMKQNKMYKYLILFLLCIIFVLLIININLSNEISEKKIEERKEFFHPGTSISGGFEPEIIDLPSFGQTTLTQGLILDSPKTEEIIIIDDNERQIKCRDKYIYLPEAQIEIETFPLMEKEISVYYAKEAKKAWEKIPGRLKKGDGVIDLREFNKKVRGKPKYKEDGGWTIEKDYSRHGKSRYKLFNEEGQRIASIGENGEVLRK